MILSLEDRLAILELAARYSHAFDYGDTDAWVATFTQDGVLTNGQASLYNSYLFTSVHYGGAGKGEKKAGQRVEVPAGELPAGAFPGRAHLPAGGLWPDKVPPL